MNGIEVAGWTLLHFLWQGTLIAAVAAVGLRLLRSAQPRYAFACSALVLMLAAPVVTAWALSGTPSTTPAAFVASTDAAVSSSAVSPSLPERRGASSETPAAAGAPRLPSIDLTAVMPFIVTIWLSGVALLLARLTGGCWRVRRLHRDACCEPVSEWQVAADRIARRLRLPRPAFIVDSKRIDAPTVIGWMRPVILLPVAAMAHLAPNQVEAILAHELAHIRRHDFLVNVLQTIAETLLFYHPAVWWISSRIRTEREHCCDDVAVEVCGDPVGYAAALTELAAWSLGRPRLVVAATGGSLIVRVRRLLQVTSDQGTRSSSGLLIGGLTLGLAIAAGGARAITVARQSDDAVTTTRGDGRVGPGAVNRFLGFELFPAPRTWPTDDPRDGNAWNVTIKYASGDMPMIGFTGRSIIRLAYGMVDTPIVGAPEWLDRESFAVESSSDLPVTAGVSDPEGLQAALRTLVDQRLGLVAHVEQREFPVYALVRATGALGPNIRPTTAACWNAETLAAARATGQLARDIGRRFCGIEDTFTGFSAANATLAEFVASLRPPHNLVTTDRPIVDRTGLTAAYDFEVRLGFIPLAAMGHHHPALGVMLSPFGIRSLFTALPEQLGLELQESTALFDVFVIDHIEKPAT